MQFFVFFQWLFTTMLKLNIPPPPPHAQCKRGKVIGVGGVHIYTYVYLESSCRQ